MTHREVLFDDTTPGTARIAKTPEGAIVVSDPKAVAQWWLREMKGKFIGVLKIGNTGFLLTVDELAGDGISEDLRDRGIWFNDAENGSTHIRTWREVHEDLGAAIRRAEQ